MHHQRIVLLPEVLNSFQYAFIIPAYALFATMIIQLIQVCLSTYENVNVPKTSMSETVINEPVRPSKIFLIFYIGTLFFAATSYQVTYSFLHPFTRCDEYLQVTSEESATNVIWYWLANMLGRFFIMYLLNKKYNVRIIFTCVGSRKFLFSNYISYYIFSSFAHTTDYCIRAASCVCFHGARRHLWISTIWRHSSLHCLRIVSIRPERWLHVDDLRRLQLAVHVQPRRDWILDDDRQPRIRACTAYCLRLTLSLPAAHVPFCQDDKRAC